MGRTKNAYDRWSVIYDGDPNPQTSGDTITFSVTHPRMNWQEYELSFVPSLILSAESDIHPYRFCGYFEAVAMAGLRLIEFRQVPVYDSIKEYLTDESFQKVKGRYQIAIFHLAKRIIEQDAAGNAAEPRR